MEKGQDKRHNKPGKQPEEPVKTDERFMKEAIRQAAKAKALMEVPIGCVIVYNGKIIAVTDKGVYYSSKTKARFPTRKLTRSARLPGFWATGGWKAAPFM